MHKVDILKVLSLEILGSYFQEQTPQRFHLHPENSNDKPVKVDRIQLE